MCECGPDNLRRGSDLAWLTSDDHGHGGHHDARECYRRGRIRRPRSRFGDTC